MARKSKTEEAWEKLSTYLNLSVRLNAGEVVEVDSDTIKKVSGREPRLMMKFDFREQRPKAISKATILPVSNGEYIIFAGDGYHDFEEVENPSLWQPASGAKRLLTLPWEVGPSSESQALDMALTSGMLANFLKETEVNLTIRGRLRAPKFTFQLPHADSEISVNVEGVQVEVDAGLEGDKVHLVEAKLGSRDNFHVRQLYYPFRMWQELVPSKSVTAVFCSYSDKVFSLRQYDFNPTDSYQSIVLVARADYTLDYATETLSLADILEDNKLERLPNKVPFPQADDFEKVIDIIDAVAAGIVETEEIAEYYSFNPRQADYYRNAAQFLGFLERDKGGFELTKLGSQFALTNRDRRHILLLSRMASLPVFRQGLEWFENKGVVPDKQQVAQWVEEETTYTGATVGRRASTVVAWTKWANAIINSDV